MSVLDESPIPLSAACKLLPSRGGKVKDVKTVRGYVRAGKITPRGRVKLEAEMVGGIWFTSAAAVRRFVAALTAARFVEPVPVRTPAAARRAYKAANDRLAAAGW